MPAITDYKQQLTELTTFKFIASAFTEASAVKLKNIRATFETNRTFYEDISHLYHIVKLSAIKHQIKIPASSQADKPVLGVAITSNLRFYGALNMNIMQKFSSWRSKQDSDLMVIGTTGDDYLKSIRFPHPYRSIVFSQDVPRREELVTFLERTKGYDQVIVFYPKFFSLLSQMVGMVDITLVSEPEKKDIESQIECIYEPELSKILNFFETQIRTLLFLRVMLETDLARTAARLMAMSAAEERTDHLITEQKRDMVKLMRSIANAQLLETFAGIKQWHR